MRAFKLSFVLFFIMAVAMSQSIQIQGVVKDSLDTPLEMANVMAVEKLTDKLDSYGISNGNGKYKLDLRANTTYLIKASYIGYQPFEQEFTTTDKNETLDIVLKTSTKLNEVEIVYEMPVSISGDTIVYNADSFKNGTERKLEDVLKKLPGVEVNDDGEIEVEGKQVQKVMVEGKDFFDGDTKIATKNIPADALDKIQVLRNYNEVSNLKGLENNEENVALNIKLKEGKKNFWFGDVTLGGGAIAEDDVQHLVNPKVFYYNPKFSVNVIGNLNNIGESPLSMRDYYKFTGGFRNMSRKGGSSFNVSSNDLGILTLNNDRTSYVDSKFGAANFTFNPSKALTISGFGIMLANQTEIENNRITNRVDQLPDGTTSQISETRDDISNQDSKIGIVKLSTSYIPSTEKHFEYDALIKFSDQSENQYVNSNILSEITTNKVQKPLTINQNLSCYYTYKKKHVFAVENQHLFKTEDPVYQVNLQNQPFNLVGYNINQNRQDITQNREITTGKLDSKVDYYFLATPKSNINITLGNTYSKQGFDSSIFQLLDNGVSNQLTDQTNSNQVDYWFNDVYLGLHYRFIKGKFTFNPGASLHYYNTKDSQLSSEVTQSFTRVLPDVYAKYQIKKSETLTYNYSFTNEFSDITNLIQGYVFSNYNSLFRGNRYLENAVYQTHSLRYFRFNMFNFENIFANVNYSKKINSIKSKTLFQGVNQVSSLENMNSDFADETFSASGRYGRSFLRYYKASVGANVSWNLFYNQIIFRDADNDPNNNPIEVQSTESFTQNYNVKFSTNFRDLPNLSLGYRFTINDYSNDVFYTDTPSVNLEYYFLKGFSFVADYSYFNNRNKSKTVNTEYDFLSAELRYQKKDSKWEYKLAATNILQTNAVNTNSFNQLGGVSNFSSYQVQPRYLIFSLRYSL